MDKISFFKTQFYKKNQLIHINNAGLSPISLPAYNEINKWSQRFFEEGYFTDKDYANQVTFSREQVAELIGCSSDQIAFFQSASWAITQFINSIDLKPQDEVLLWDQEYSSHLLPWKIACEKKYAQLVQLTSSQDLKTPSEHIFNHINSKTKVFAFSLAQYQSGAMIHEVGLVIKKLKERGILIFIDACQSLGVLPDHYWPSQIDGLVGTSHKWLTSPVGVGFLALGPELILKAKPLSYGSGTYGSCDDTVNDMCYPKKSAQRFEPGAKQVLEICALGKSIELILATGVSNLYTESLRLSRLLKEGLSQFKGSTLLNSNHESFDHPIINWTPPPQGPCTAQALQNELLKNGISTAFRAGGIRFSPHAFNTDQEIHYTLDKLSELIYKKP